MISIDGLYNRTERGDSLFGDCEKNKTNKCSLCGDDAGYDAVVVDGDTVCGNCLAEFDISDVLDLLGLNSIRELVCAFEGYED